MSEKTKFIKRVGLIGFTNIITLLVGLILIPVFTKGKPIEYYGIWVQINVSLNLIPALTCLGLPYTLVRYLPGEKDPDKIGDTVYSIISTVIIINTILAPFIAYLVIRYVTANQTNLIPIFTVLLIIQAIYSVGIAYLRALQRVKKYSLIIITQNMITALVVSLLISWGYGIKSALEALLLINTLITLILISEIIRDNGIRLPRFKDIGEHLSFGLPTILGNFSDWIVSSSDRYLIGYFMGIAYVGYYNPSYSIASLVNIFMWPLVFMLPPKLSELYEDGHLSEIRLYLEYSLKYYLLLAIPSLFGISALSKPVLAIISTPEIASKSFLIVPIVSASVILYGIYAIISQIFVIKKRTGFIARVWMIAATLNFALNIIAIPYLGLLGAAIATLFAYILSFVLTVRYANKLFKVPFRLLDTVKITLGGTAMYLMITFIGVSKITEVIVTVIGGTLFYFLLMYLLGVFSKKELDLLKST